MIWRLFTPREKQALSEWRTAFSAQPQSFDRAAFTLNLTLEAVLAWGAKS